MHLILDALDFAGQFAGAADEMILWWRTQHPSLEPVLTDVGHARQVSVGVAGSSEPKALQACLAVREGLRQWGISGSLDNKALSIPCCLGRAALIEKLRSISWVQGPFHLINANVAGVSNQILQSDFAPTAPGFYAHHVIVYADDARVYMIVDGKERSELRVDRRGRARRRNTDFYTHLGQKLCQAVISPLPALSSRAG